MDVPQGERMVFTFPQYCRLARQFRIRIRSLFVSPMPPTYYAQVSSKDDGEVVCLLWLDSAKEEWVAFAPDEVTDEVEGLFS